jgi:MFS family permease
MYLSCESLPVPRLSLYKAKPILNVTFLAWSRSSIIKETATLAISIYFPFYVLATPVATVLVRRLDPRIFPPAVTLSFGLVFIGLGFYNTYKDQVGSWAVLGLLEGCYSPSASFVISMYYTRQELAKRMASFFVGGLIFGALGGLIAYGQQQMDGVGGKSGC